MGSRGEETTLADLVVIAALSLVLGVILCIPSLSGSGGDLASGGEGALVGALAGDERQAWIEGHIAIRDGFALDLYDTSDGVAVEVNDVAIGERAVDRYLAEYRAAWGLESDAALRRWLAMRGEDEDALRMAAIGNLVELELLRQAADDAGLGASKEDVDDTIESLRKGFASDEDFVEYLANLNETERKFEIDMERQMLRNRLVEEVAGDVVASDDDVLAYLVRADDKLEDVGGSDAEGVGGTGAGKAAGGNAAGRAGGGGWAGAAERTLADFSSGEVDQARAVMDWQAKIDAFEAWFEKFKADSEITETR